MGKQFLPPFMLCFLVMVVALVPEFVASGCSYVSSNSNFIFMLLTHYMLLTCFFNTFDCCIVIFKCGYTIASLFRFKLTTPLVSDFVVFSYSDICSPFNQDVYYAHLLDVVIIHMTVTHYCSISLSPLLHNKDARLQCCIICSYSILLVSFTLSFPPSSYRWPCPVQQEFCCWYITPCNTQNLDFS
jgi:hypothetical protein